MPVLCRLEAVRRSFGSGPHRLEVLRGVDLEVVAGERIGITGRSGAGKSTLLAVLGLVDAEFEGRYEFDGEEVGRRTERERAEIRLRRIGIAFQDLHLVPALTAEENVALPAAAAGLNEADARERAGELLSAAGLGGRRDHRPGQLSGGERRRVAFARALVNRPALLLLDEPTTELDAESASGVRALIDRAHNEGAAIVAATHDPALLEGMNRRFGLVAGVLAEPKTIEETDNNV